MSKMIKSRSSILVHDSDYDIDGIKSNGSTEKLASRADTIKHRPHTPNKEESDGFEKMT